MNIVLLSAILIIGLLTLLAIGVPIAFGLSFLSVIGILLLIGPDGLTAIISIAWGGLANFVLTPLPLFILMGEFITLGAIGDDIFELAHKWLGRLPGGMAVATTSACAIFGAMCGTSIGAVAAIAPASVQQMLERGYDKKIALGSVCAAGSLAMLIPPSAPLILYGIIAETSIGALFIAGVIPGILIAALISFYIIIRVLKNRSLAPSVPGFSWKAKLSALKLAWAPLLLILAVLGTIYTGIATPSESAAIGALVAFLLCALKRFEPRKLGKILLAVTCTNSMICMILVGALSFGYLLNIQQIPQNLSNWVVSLSLSPWVVMIMLQLILIAMGCFLDSGSLILITMPILLPVVVGLGFDLTWFGILIIINIEIGVVTPPVGLNLYVLKAVAPPSVTLKDIIWGVFPFIFILAGALAIVMVFPQIALWLPATMK
ncbi:TRAP transporter large permease [Chloroflexota bacterium]